MPEREGRVILSRWSRERAVVVNGRDTSLGSRHPNVSLLLNKMLPEMNVFYF